jgi:putative cell wall-binding protein
MRSPRPNDRKRIPTLVALCVLTASLIVALPAASPAADPIRLTTMPDGADVVEFAITPDGSRVVYRADADTVGTYELYSVPIGGPTTSAVKLSQVLVAGGDVQEFDLGGDRAVFLADAEVDGRTEAYSVPVDGSSAPVKLNKTLVAGGTVSGVWASPDGTRAAYVADQNVQYTREIYGIPIVGPAAAGYELIDPSLCSDCTVNNDPDSVQFSSDSAWVVFTAYNRDEYFYQLFASPADGSAGDRFLVDGTVEGIEAFLVRGGSILYVGEDPMSYEQRLYATVLANPPAPVQLSSDPVSSGSFGTMFDLSSDGTMAVYTNYDDEMKIVPTTGGVATILAENAGFEFRPRFTTDGAHVVMTLGHISERLWSVPTSGSLGDAVQLSDAIIEEFDLDPNGSIVVYRPIASPEINAVPVAGPAAAGAQVADTNTDFLSQDAVVIDPTGSTIVYIRDTYTGPSGLEARYDVYTVPLAFADLSVTASADPAFVAYGDTTTFTFEVGYGSSDGSQIGDLTVAVEPLGIQFTSGDVVSGDDGDGILDTGETWRFEYTTTVRPLTMPLSPFDVIATAIGTAPSGVVQADATATLEIDRDWPNFDVYVLGGSGVVSDTVFADLGGYTGGTVTRLSGADRYATAAAISAEFFDPGVPAAFVATGTNFPDALAGGPVASRVGGPILLVRETSIPPATAAELTRLDPQRIVILGGSGVIADSVQSALAAYTAGTVERLAGIDRYATAAAISASYFESGVPVAFVATGANFPDALAGGPAAAVARGPILLVTQTTIPPATAAELARLDPGKIVILGGSGVVTDDVKSALGAYTTGGVERLSGATRYSTAQVISSDSFPRGASAVFIATASNFPDALAGGPIAAIGGGPILLVAATSIPPDTAWELTAMGHRDPRDHYFTAPSVVYDVADTRATVSVVDMGFWYCPIGFCYQLWGFYDESGAPVDQCNSLPCTISTPGYDGGFQTSENLHFWIEGQRAPGRYSVHGCFSSNGSTCTGFEFTEYFMIIDK